MIFRLIQKTRFVKLMKSESFFAKTGRTQQTIEDALAALLIRLSIGDVKPASHKHPELMFY